MTIDLGIDEGGRTMTDSETAELSILFGSQTGNAEYLAYQIHAKSVKNGLDAGYASLNDWLADRASGVKRLLVVTSTHDNGHMPDNAAEFWSWLQTLERGALDGLPYAVLSIGDSMYEDFCKAGHDIDQRLEELGAVRIVESIDCDIDFEFSAERWATPAVQSLIDATAWDGSLPTELPHEADEKQSQSAIGDQACTARITASRVLSAPGSTKRVTHYELSFDAGGFDYAPGDSLSVFVQNSDALVDRWIGHFGDQELAGGSLRQVLTHEVELRLPHPGLVVGLARRCPESSQAAAIVALLQSGDREALDAWLWGRDVLDVVIDLGCADLSVVEIMQELRPLQHRDYSISSSPLRDDGQVHLTVAGVEYESPYGRHAGAATDYLRARAEDGREFEVRRVPAHEFRLPADDVPVIMIGPGVGVAPFRAFLRERDARGAAGDNWLFFGDQHRAFDWLYEDEFGDLQLRGILSRVDLAFSRDQAAKRYVQHAMRENARELRKWVDAGAYIFVCGDKARMAADVDRALAEILGAGDAVAGDTLVAELKRAERYVKDVY
ncbi:sulfite reductase flavoprotein subunit alpha [Microbacterium sp. WCS2018Hpa-9]|uniref:diflavin oxidoreductase n=1 Tax=Microbacterium sp. WCS2018Hpa-9 TaxID=3073635 RepID=UPI00288C4708|nr:sulfite reductase flavoprotein subunit alpha [Microbacterium sp. WCS2018Hpa-9]